MCFWKREYKVFQRFYGYRRFWDRLLLITKDKKIAEKIAQDLTKNGISEDGRRDFEGVVN